jgi:hypothetical protein
MAEQVEHGGRHFFTVLEHLGSEADRLGIRAVDSCGNPESASDFLDTVMRYILAREAQIDSLRREVRTQRQEIAALREERRALIGADAPPERCDTL